MKVERATTVDEPWTEIPGEPSYPILALVRSLEQDDRDNGIAQEVTCLVRSTTQPARLVRLTRQWIVTDLGRIV